MLSNDDFILEDTNGYINITMNDFSNMEELILDEITDDICDDNLNKKTYNLNFNQNKINKQTNSLNKDKIISIKILLHEAYRYNKNNKINQKKIIKYIESNDYKLRYYEDDDAMELGNKMKHDLAAMHLFS